MNLLIQNRNNSSVWNNKAHSSIAKPRFALIATNDDSAFFFSLFGLAINTYALVCATSTGAKTNKTSGHSGPEPNHFLIFL